MFVDTSAWVALSDDRDGHHGRAVAIQRRLVNDRRWRLVTSNFTVAETHARLLRQGRRAADGFLSGLGSSAGTHIERIEPEDEERALAILHQYEDKRWSLVDVLSFAVMERLKIQHAFAFDQHFGQYGRFVVLTPNESW